MNRRFMLPLLAVLSLAACRQQDMFGQERAFFWSTFSYFPNGREMQHPPSGAVARNAPNQPVPQPASITAEMLARGREKFNIDCAPCHDRTGDADGMVVQRGFPKPPILFSPKLLQLKAQKIYNVITHGHGVMYSYANRVAPPDRWAIVAYIRALQLSEHAKVAQLPKSDQAALRNLSR